MVNELDYREADGKRQLLLAYGFTRPAAAEAAARTLAQQLRTSTKGVSVRAFRRFWAVPVAPATRQNERLAGGGLSDIKDEVFDYVFLVVADGEDELRAVTSGDALQSFERALQDSIRSRHSGVFANTYRYRDVSTDPEKIYLFNFFATDIQAPAEVWKRSSGWFFKHASFRSSYNMQAVDGRTTYRLVNFAHLDSVPQLVLATLMRRRSLNLEVAEVFRDNRMITLPILFRELAPA